MSDNQEQKTFPALGAKILYPMVRINEVDRSVKFYTEVLGMTLFRRRDYEEGRFTLLFLGFEEEGTWFELTHNWDGGDDIPGKGFGHLSIGVTDIYAACERLKTLGIEFIREPGPMKFVSKCGSPAEVIAFLTDPDGYRIELIEHK